MANTYTLISSNVLTGSAASVTFSSIPSTYTDLVLRWSSRQDNAAANGNSRITVNANGANYSETTLDGDGATATSARQSADTFWRNIKVPANTATANTFNNCELYIPNYAGSQNKVGSLSVASENNATTAYLSAFALLWGATTAISSIEIIGGGVNFVSGSSFYLYGIKNS